MKDEPQATRFPGRMSCVCDASNREKIFEIRCTSISGSDCLNLSLKLFNLLHRHSFFLRGVHSQSLGSSRALGTHLLLIRYLLMRTRGTCRCNFAIVIGSWSELSTQYLMSLLPYVLLTAAKTTRSNEIIIRKYVFRCIG